MQTWNGRKRVSFQKCAVTISYLHVKMTLEKGLRSFIKIELKVEYSLNIEFNTIKLPESNEWEESMWLEVWQFVFRYITESITHTKKEKLQVRFQLKFKTSLSKILFKKSTVNHKLEI